MQIFRSTILCGLKVLKYVKKHRFYECVRLIFEKITKLKFHHTNIATFSHVKLLLPRALSAPTKTYLNK